MVLEGKCAVFGGVQQASTCFEHDTRLELRLNMCPWYAKNTEIFATTPSSWRFFQVGPTSHLTGTLVIQLKKNGFNQQYFSNLLIDPDSELKLQYMERDHIPQLAQLESKIQVDIVYHLYNLYLSCFSCLRWFRVQRWHNRSLDLEGQVFETMDVHGGRWQPFIVWLLPCFTTQQGWDSGTMWNIRPTMCASVF